MDVNITSKYCKWAVYILVFCIAVIHGRNDSGFSVNSDELCAEPGTPTHGTLECDVSEKKKNRIVCKATCDDGYLFPDGKNVKKHNCNKKSGKWKPEYLFPDCNPACEPHCDNGGECLEGNICICSANFRGHRCQYPLELCDPSEGFSLSADWKCNHTSVESVCTLNCPEGTEYEFLPAEFYHCTLGGIWSPKSAPKCKSTNIIEASVNPGLYKDATGIARIPHKHAVCAMWNHFHYRTFDGGIYSFEGNCAYILAKDCTDNTFAIHVKQNVTTLVVIYIGKDEYILTTHKNVPYVEHGGTEYIIPITINAQMFEIVADYITLSSSLGFRLKWDGKSTVFLKINNQLKNKTCGLCGRFDDSALNDFEMSDGSITDTVVAFANSWKVDDLKTEACTDGAVTVDPCSAKDSTNASEACQVIFDPKFAPCHSFLDPKPFFKSCKIDYCACTSAKEECICESLSQYFSECIRLGGKLENSWRSENLCPLACPKGMSYENCGSSCPKTCRDTVYDCEDDHCVEGCHCPPSTVLHNGQCVEKSECPCLHKGIEYESGKRIQKDCNACECYGGKWQCTNKKCEARCSSVADPHYTTFDGAKFNFVGSCPVYLVFHDNFSIIQESIPCASIGDQVEGNYASLAEYCTKAVTMYYGDSIIQLKPEMIVTFNNKEIILPFSENGLSILFSSSIFLKVILANQLSLMWDGKSRIYIDAPPTLYDQTRGLCGTFNHNQNDDFLTPEGDLESDVSVFASRWQVSDKCHKRARRSDRSLCDMQPQKMEDSRMLCGLLKSDLFSLCHNDVDPESYFKNCLYDMCSCNHEMSECICPSFADYGSACSQKGIILNWVDTIATCMPECKGGQVYQECVKTCQTSCSAISFVQNCEEAHCVQGCACPYGMALNEEGVCIPIGECPCIYEGRSYTAKTSVVQGTKICDCENAIWNCHAGDLREIIKLNPDIMIEDAPVACSLDENQVFTPCVEECPTTCQNKHLPHRCKTDVCRPGCRCQDGYIMDSDVRKCITVSECGCRHGGHRYKEGDSIKKDCNTCFCNGSFWQCTEKVCPGMCTVWGESHFKTYDGRIYDFHGDCEYILSKGKTHDESFTISVQNVPCGTSGVTCSKSFSIEINGLYKVTLSQHEALPKNENGSPFIVLESGLYVFVYTKVGISLQWDKGTRMIITLSPKWQAKVNGLCGNFNYDQSDDFQIPSGGLPEVRVELFADSWKVHEFCPHPETVVDACTINPSRVTWSHQKCGILKSSIFAPCHSEVSLEPYYDRCIFDVCACDEGGDCECLCTAIATYVQECNIHGVHIKWRSQELCPIQCEECSTYSSCMSPCPERTCESQTLVDAITEICITEPCVEGCNPKPCPSGQIYNNTKDFKCIPETDCVVPCLEINGKMYTEGERITDPSITDTCQSCHCLQGSVSCTGKPCPTTTTTEEVYLKIGVVCKETGWTPWLNTKSNHGGDFELLENPMISKKLSEFCGIHDITDIECRVSNTKLPYKETGQNVLCSIPEGLICNDSNQNSAVCEDYEIRLFCDCGYKEEEVIPFSTEVSCLSSGWTAWMNSHIPDSDGELEIYPLLRKEYTFCSKSEIHAVECRSRLTWENPLEAKHPNVECTVKDGLICKNTEFHQCEDYEIRFYCKCKGEICTPGWTEFFNVDNPQNNVNHDDDETIENLRKYYSFCPDEMIMDVECKTMVNGELIDYKETDEFGLKCSKRVGFLCNSILRQKECLDYQIRFYCSCGITEPQTLLPTTTTTTTPTTTIYPCPPGQIYDECAYQCNQTCSAFSYQLMLSNKCNNPGSTGCIASCRPFEGCQPPMLWRDYNNCVPKEECTCIIPDENGQFLYVAPNDVIEHNCEKCQCIDDNLNCHSIPHCGETTATFPALIKTTTATTTTTVSSTSVTTAALPPVNIETLTCWTEWINVDSPESGGGDSEDIATIRRKFEFCDNPVKIECRRVLDKKQSSLTDQVLVCDLNSGLQCWNSANGVDGCYDYEIRFYCPCETTTTVPPTTLPPTTLSTAAPGPCLHGWTEWFNSHYPNADGEFETVQSIRAHGSSFCSSDMIVAIECKQTGTANYSPLQHGVMCDLQVGFTCYNAYRDPLDYCHDYEVRFYCDCPVKTLPTTVVASEQTIPLFEVTSAPSGRFPKRKPCSQWSDWINQYHPSKPKLGVKSGLAGTGDHEKMILWRLQKEFNFCLEGYISDIECRDAATDVDFTETGDVGLQCRVKSGFRCRGPDQPSGVCRDYKIRYFCECEEEITTITIVVRPTLTSISVPQCTSYYEIVDGPNPLPDTSLRASTSLNPISGPQSARLSSTKGYNSAGAWIAETVNDNQFLEVDLGEIKPVYGVVTKGQNGANEWVTSYHILYSRDGISFSYVMESTKGKETMKIFSGNYDSDSPVEHIFEHPFEARFIRIQPLTHKNEIALRVDFLGCAEGMSTLAATTQAPPVCIDEMGMQNGNISDSQLSFSTTYDQLALPSNIRIGAIQLNDQPGAWVAGILDTEQYAQVDFWEPRTITGLITQGRELVPQWVTAFSVSYSQDGITWSNILDKDGEIKVFPGNFDSDTLVTTYFEQPVRARFFRVKPQKWKNWIAMRLEIIGCFEPYEVTTLSESVLAFTITTSLPPFMKGICEDPMGFENHQLPDASIYVSSSAFVWSGASRIRLNQRADEQGTGGWLPSSSDSMPYVLIDFYDDRNVTGIITQGREDADMWVQSYTVQYSSDNITWNFCRDLAKNDFVFPGNKDRSTPDIRLFDKMVVARFIKITIKSYHNRPSLRLEILGCYKNYVKPTTETTPSEQCILYGPWLSISDSVMYGDEEPIDKLIHYSGVCLNPLTIECREMITKQNYEKTGQNVICDLTHGLQCKNSEQSTGHCFNYEARIGCWICEVSTVPTTTTTTTTLRPLVVCPELDDALIYDCPLSCPQDYACDGKTCIPYVECPCFKEGKRFKPGDIYVTKSCEHCDCLLEGHSRCQPIKCPPCEEGQTSELSKSCKCECKGCALGTVLCPTSKQCINESFWCDGTVDCPDDETDCPTTAPPSTTTSVAPSTTTVPVPCSLTIDSESDLCEMNMNAFTTFDGSHYQYEICHHILMKEANEKFLISVHKQCNGSNSNQCHRYLMIYIDDIQVQLGPGSEEVVFNGYEVPVANLWLLAKRFPGVNIKKYGNQIVLHSYTYNFQVIWNSWQHIKIVVSECWMHQLAGLCGFYNDVPGDDFMKPDGSLATGGEDFGNSWSIENFPNCDIHKCTPEVLMHASEVCVKLYEQPFNSCSSYLDIPTQIDICMAFICECMTSALNDSEIEACQCDAYESFVEDCEANKKGFLEEWRIKYNCVPDCPPGLEWQDCGPGCDLTCENYREQKNVCDDKCVPGCYCPPGLIHHNNQCVRQKMCQDCVCRGHGDPNYITFDNQYYAFQGNCTYILAQHLSEKETLKFQILGVNYECPDEPHTSCTAGIKVLWNGHVIEKFQYQPVYFDGVPIGTDLVKFEESGVSITYVPRKSTIIYIKDINLAVRYFDQMYAFNIELPAYLYFNKTEGLCGICNFDQSDDLYHRDGYVTEDIDDFAYSWLVDNTRDECILPRVVVPSPPPEICNFTANACDLFLDPTLYSKSCQNDISYSHNPDQSMCRSKFQYAQQCCEKGVSLKEWLFASGCSTTCPENMVFECTSACEATCDNYDQTNSDVCNLMPLYTCTCPQGQVLKDGHCVDPSSCVPEKAVCVYQHKFQVVNGLQVPLMEQDYYDVEYDLGAQWNDGLCINCSCIQMGEQLTSTCLVLNCPDESEFPDIDNYVYEAEVIPGVCCPKYRRVQCINNGMKYLVNESWASPDGDNCKTLHCVSDTTIGVIIAEGTIICDKVCPAYAEYIEPLPESSFCCGHCKPVACEENGIIYADGAVWKPVSKPCVSAECIVSENMTSIIYTQKSCPELPHNCPQEHIQLDVDGCCFTCDIPTDTCDPAEIPLAETVQYFSLLDKVHGVCSNSQPILNLTKCSGHCEASSLYSEYHDDFESTCKCCLPMLVKERRVTLDCADGSTVTKLYHEPQACHCSSCGKEVTPGTIELPTPY